MTDTPKRPSKAHLQRTAAAYRAAAGAREMFATIAMELAATHDWVVDPSYRETWARLDADYQAARKAYTDAREVAA